MSRWLSGRTAIITGTDRITWGVGRINRVKRRHGTSTIQGMRSPIRKLAIGALILFFAPIWSPTIASTLTDSRGGQVPGLSTDIDHSPIIKVELDIFSGRPNPSWELRDGQAQTLLNMLAGIRRSSAERRFHSPPDLGYRGLYLRIVADSQPSTWHVFDGNLEHNGQFFDDSARTVEAYVFRSMPEQLSKDLSAILPQIKP